MLLFEFCCDGSSGLDVHWGEGQDLGPLLLPQFCSDDAANSRSDGLASLVDEDASIIVELDDAAVWPLPLLGSAHNDCVPHIASPDLVCCADGHAVARLGAKVALLLHHHDDAVACYRQPRSTPVFVSVLGWHIPTLAGRFERRTLTHSTIAAPELSMQLTSDWI